MHFKEYFVVSLLTIFQSIKMLLFHYENLVLPLFALLLPVLESSLSNHDKIEIEDGNCGKCN